MLPRLRASKPAAASTRTATADREPTAQCTTMGLSLGREDSAASSGRGIEPGNASPALQAGYLEALERWSQARGLTTFVFEAFDEPWKGSADPLEPEKHWGLFTVDRRPKLAVQGRFPPAQSAPEVSGRPAFFQPK